MINKKMTEYYARRAGEYERIYQKPERQKELKQIQDKVTRCFQGLDLLEIACGTGYWTQFASRSARSITATDCNDEVLAVARQKDYGPCRVEFIRSDAYSLAEINGSFSAALAGFWWSHVPVSKLAGFLRVLHAKLRKGACIVVFDNRYVEGSSTPIARADEEGNTYQIRALSDGSKHEVLKNFTTPSQLCGWIEPVAEKCEPSESKHFWMVEYTLK